MKNVYLISSDSFNLLNDKIKEISGDNKNITYHSLNEVTIFDVIEDASYYGLFSEERIIVIRDTKFFGGKFLYEEESNAIVNFITNLDMDTKVIFICDDIKKTKELTKKVIDLGATIYDLNTNNEEHKNNLITEYLKENDIILDKDARNILYEYCLDNIDIFIQEIKKLSLIDKHITSSLVKEYCNKFDKVDAFEFSNAVISKNYKKAFDELEILINNGVDVYSIVGLLASSYTNMYMVKDAVNYGLTDDEIAKKFGYSSTGRVYVMKKNGKIYTSSDLEEIIKNLYELDKKIKTGYNPVYELKEFLLNL